MVPVLDWTFRRTEKPLTSAAISFELFYTIQSLKYGVERKNNYENELKNIKVNFPLEQTTKVQRRSRGINLHFL